MLPSTLFSLINIQLEYNRTEMHIKKTHYDLQREIITFGPRMAHDDTIDALAYACKFAYPCDYKEGKDGGWIKKKPKAKSWVTA